VKAQVTLRCYECHPKRETWGEVAIKQWLQAHQIPFEQWDRKMIKPLELDFYLPAHNMAIEFNGIWYHRHDKLQDKKYHQNKWRTCADQNIRLIQIWEHELTQKPDIIWDRLSHVCNLPKIKVGARKCEVRKVCTSEHRSFVNQSHLQGYLATSNAWGLYLDTELVSLASFVKSRYGGLADHELARYCVKPGYNVQGGLSKLLKVAQSELGIKCLVSYSNLNWGLGQVYAQTGFELHHVSPPNYWYFKNVHDVQSRLKFQKHKIVGLAPGNTEQEIAQNMGYSRFYDAGSAVWIKSW
jgi:hypothetical protein